MFPLSKKILIRGVKEHIKAGLGAAADYEAVYVGFKIPFDGIAFKFKEEKGGNWLRITRPNGDRIELAHLSEYFVSDGQVREGQNGGITGNTGTLTTGAHLHIQVFDKKGNRLDPEAYNWGNSSLITTDMHRSYKGTVYLLSMGYWVAIATTGDEYKADWGVSEFPPEMTDAQFKAFPVHKRTIK